MKRVVLTFAFLLTTAAFAPAQVAVIANKSVPVDTVRKSKLLDFYTGDIRLWGNDEAVVVVDLKPRSDIKKRFYRYLGKRSSRMKSIWLKKMLSGEGDPPEALKTEEDVLHKVGNTQGAIGFLSASKVDSQQVKVLLIIPASAAQ